VKNKKWCWTLAELAGKWDCSEEDLLWLGVKEELLFSVWCPIDPFVVRQCDQLPDTPLNNTPEFYEGWLDVPAERIVEFLENDKILIGGGGLLSGEDIYIPSTAGFKEVPCEKPDVKMFVPEKVRANHEYWVFRTKLRVKQEEFERFVRESLKSIVTPCPEGDKWLYTLQEMASAIGYTRVAVKGFLSDEDGKFKGDPFPAEIRSKPEAKKPRYRVLRSVLIAWAIRNKRFKEEKAIKIK